jgi:hypothetical protein
VGRGDMLYTSADLSKPKRLQGPFVSEEEIRKIMAHIIEEGPKAEFDESVVDRQQQIGVTGLTSGSVEDTDPLLMDAKREIMTAKKASASFLQRRLKVGYARAARLLDLLEDEGFIGPADGAKPRDLLFTGAHLDDTMGIGPVVVGGDDVEEGALDMSGDEAEWNRAEQEEGDWEEEDGEEIEDDDEAGEDEEVSDDDEEESDPSRRSTELSRSPGSGQASDEEDEEEGDDVDDEDEYLDKQVGEYLEDEEDEK